MILLKPYFHRVQWVNIQKSSRQTESFDPVKTWPAALRQELNDAEIILYNLPNGGNHFTEPLVSLTPENISKMRECSVFSILNNTIIEAAMRAFQEYPNANHFMLIETAFFSTLPMFAKAYPLPFSFFQDGIQRFGSDGLLHQAAWNMVAPYLDIPNPRVVSIALGDYPNVAAIKAGQAVETSCGFSSLEGIPGLHTCGDIDPELAVSLAASGYQPNEIETLLSQQSGFRSFCPQQTAHLCDLVSKEKCESRLIREILARDIQKAVGAAVAALGGIDCLIWSAEEVKQWHPFLLEVCKNFSFMGLSATHNSQVNPTLFQLSEPEATKIIYEWQYDIGNMILSLIQTIDPTRLM